MGRVRALRGQSKVKQIDLYTRGALYGVPWLLLLVEAPAVVEVAGSGPRSRALCVALVVVVIAQSALGVGLLRRAVDRYLGEEPAGLRWRLAGSFVLLAAALCLLATVRGATDEAVAQLGTTVLMGVSVAPFGGLCLIVRKRTYAAVAVAGSLLSVVPYAVTGMPGPGLAAAAVGMLFLCAWDMVMARVSGWMLSIVWEVDAARGVQARLAVAEERLRFSRDMHDILGRNLAVIALKSELAVQLSRRATDAAAEQMAEVQRIAQESQRELREVVRGYREADLHTELVGARGVLTAAGIECRIDDAAAVELPVAVQSALAWVVREATTNVLRHADARRCAVRLRQTDGWAVLMVENNGVRADGAASGKGSGSGLAGLRERLTELGGTLAYAYGAQSTFRVTARVPFAGPAGAEGGPPPVSPAGAALPGDGETFPPPLPSPAAAAESGRGRGDRRCGAGPATEGTGA